MAAKFAVGELKEPHKIFEYTSKPDHTFAISTPEWRSTVTNNSHGFRGQDLDLTADKRIMWLGDSYVQAVQVEIEKSAPYLLSQRLEKDGHDIVINNLGMGSWSGIQYYNAVRLLGRKYRPDVIIITVFYNDPAGDILRNSQPDVIRNSKGLVTEMGEALIEKEIPITDHFFLTCLPREIISGLKNQEPVPPDAEYYGLIGNAEQNVRVLAAYLGEIKNIADEIGATLVLSALPFINQIAPGQVALGYHTTGTVLKEYEVRQDWPDIMRDFSIENDILYVDLLDGLRKHSDKQLFFKIDGHFNEQGHQIFSNIFYDFLVSRDIVGRSKVRLVKEIVSKKYSIYFYNNSFYAAPSNLSIDESYLENSEHDPDLFKRSSLAETKSYFMGAIRDRLPYMVMMSFSDPQS